MPEPLKTVRRAIGVSTWAAGVDRRNHLNNAALGLARTPRGRRR